VGRPWGDAEGGDEGSPMSERPGAAAGEGRRGLVRRVAPGLAVLAGYHRSWLRGDLLAGVTVAAYLVPQVMAYAGLAGLPPVAGLWAILPALLLYSLLGSSRLLSVGPESTTALMTATVVAPLAAGAPDRYAELAAGLAVVVGAMFLVAWMARLGFLADLLSRPILVGYLTGVALIIIVDQLPKLTGVRTSGSEFFPQLLSFVRNLGQAHPATVIFSAAAIAFLFAVARFFPRIPGPLLALVLGTAAVAAVGLEACRRRATCRNWYCRRSACSWSGTPTSSSPRAPSRLAATNSTPTRNCRLWGPRTWARACCTASR
jgi:MFS superfamily sulfate permease-like transporter